MVGALQFEVLMAIVGTEKFSSALGLVLLMEAVAVLLGPPGAGQSTEGMTVNVSFLMFSLQICLFETAMVNYFSYFLRYFSVHLSKKIKK